ncbi:MAG: choice-of-anchor tandem repeat GloVer-containing protein [Terriglobales bacterium]
MKYTKLLGTASTALMIVIIITLALAPGIWAQTKYKTLYKFKGGKDGSAPNAGVIFDTAGNLYGTTLQGGNARCSNRFVQGCGIVFELTPNANGGWTERVLHRFNGRDGSNPDQGTLTLDGQGNLYDTTFVGGGISRWIHRVLLHDEIRRMISGLATRESP